MVHATFACQEHQNKLAQNKERLRATVVLQKHKRRHLEHKLASKVAATAVRPAQAGPRRGDHQPIFFSCQFTTNTEV